MTRAHPLNLRRQRSQADIALPILPNPRHEKFCRIYVKTGIASRAYLKAGYTAMSRSSLDSNASRLIRNEKIRQRVAELQAVTLQRHQVTQDKLLTDTEQARILAMEQGNPRAAISATELQARITGQLAQPKDESAAGSYRGLESRDAIYQRLKNEFGPDAVSAVDAIAAILANSGSELLELEAERVDTLPLPAPGVVQLSS